LILLGYILVIYLVLRLVEFGLVRAWRAYRDRPRGEQRIILKGDQGEVPRPPRPQLIREQPAEQLSADSGRAQP
jgi:hypothetical protein